MMIITKEQSFISAIVYVRNNEKTVHGFLKMLAEILDKHFDHFEVICVDDCSTDGSADEIRSAIKETENSAAVSIINMSYYQGLEAAMNAGTDIAIGDFILEFDIAENDFPPQKIIEAYQHALDGFDIVVVCPGKNQNLSSKVFYSIMKKHLPMKTSMRTERFRIISRRALNRINMINTDIPYRKVIYNNCGLHTDEIVYFPEKKIKTARSFKEKFSLAVNSLMLYTDYFSKVAMFLAILMGIIAVGIGVYAIIVYLGNSKPIEGWTTTTLFLSFGFFGTFILFAIIIKYSALKLRLQIKKQKYIFESVEKVKN